MGRFIKIFACGKKVYKKAEQKKYMDNKSERVAIFIDGSNFYHGVKNTAPKLHLSKFNYFKLSQLLSKNKNPRIIYCVGEIKREKDNQKSQILYSQQQKLFFHLESQDIELRKGYMLKNKAIYHEKGVDVRIALEILKGA